MIMDSFRISLELHKPLTGQELFFAISYNKLALETSGKLAPLMSLQIAPKNNLIVYLVLYFLLDALTEVLSIKIK